MFKPRYYFLLRKSVGTGAKGIVDQVMYLKDGKFRTTHQMYSSYLLTWPQVLKYKFLFWYHGKRGNNEKLFGYKQQTKVTGKVIVKKLF